MSVFGIVQADLENATSVATVAACFDDANTGTLNAGALAAVIDRGEQEVKSWLLSNYGPTLPPDGQLATDSFLKYAAIEYIVAHMFDRHPEYVRSNSKTSYESRFARADQRMQRIASARQRPPVIAPTIKAPANVGGTTTDDSHRIITSNNDGSSNSGDF